MSRRFRGWEVLLPIFFLVLFQFFSCRSPESEPSRIEERAVTSAPGSSGILADEKAFDALREKVLARVEKEDFKGADRILREGANRPWSMRLRGRLEILRKDLRKRSFLHHHPLVFRLWTPRRVYAFHEPIPLYFEILNLSDETVEIPTGGAFSWLPWGEKRNSFILARFSLTDVDPRQGTNCSGKWDSVLDLKGRWALEPGASMRVLHTLKLPVPPQTLYRRIEIKGRLIPGGLQTGPFDWGMIAFEFPGIVVHVVSREALPMTLSPWEQYCKGMEDLDLRAIFLGGVLAGPEEQWKVVDGIVSVLHDFSPPEARVLMCLLAWLTGEALGYDSFRWMEWWDVHRTRYLSVDLLEGRAGVDRSPEHGRETFPRRARAPSRLGESGKGTFLFSGGPAVPGCAWLSAFAASMPLASPSRTEASFPPGRAGETDRMRGALSSPFYGRRYAAIQRLQKNRKETGLLSRLLEDPDPAVRAGVATAIGGMEDEALKKALIQRLSREDDPCVRARIVQSLGLLAGRAPRPPSQELAAYLEAHPLLQKLYLDRGVMIVLEGLLHYHSTPGSYDGQYEKLWKLGPGVYEVLEEMALDPDVEFHIRSLAIMALQERRNPDLLETLRPLIMDPEDELRIEEELFSSFGRDENTILRFRMRSISKCARFSLAKAGVVRFNLDKIRVLERWIYRHARFVFRKDRNKEEGLRLGLGRTWNWIRTLGMSFMLDIGYNYQQFDRFDKARGWYLRLIKEADAEEDAALMAEAYYNLACLYAVTGKGKDAVESLQLAVKNGFTDASWMQEDRDLESIRKDPAFHKLIVEMLGREEKGNEKEKQKK